MSAKCGKCGCAPLRRFIFGEVDEKPCDGITYTLIEATAKPMRFVVAELDNNFSSIPVTYTFYTTEGKAIHKTVPAGHEISFQVPGSVFRVTVRCESCDGACAPKNGAFIEANAFLEFIECKCC